MRCRYCGAEIHPRQARCARCQRRLSESGQELREVPNYVHGALAPETAPEPAPASLRRFTVAEGGAGARRRPAVQPPLFPSESNIVGLEDYRPAGTPRRRSAASRRPRPAAAGEPSWQIAFDFDAAPLTPRELEERRERLRAAPLGRRAVACVADLAVAAAVGVLPFLIAVRGVLGASWPADRSMGLALGACCWVILALYHLLFAVSGRSTLGQQLAGLRLVTLEGRPGEPTHRVARVLFYMIPPACLMGTAWAAVTEERFSWADQITRTYFATSARRS